MSDGKNKYITAYGSSNADSYGRGDVTDISTKYNMLTTNPLSDESAPKMNSYSSDGSYNQDIFGWKCFNSPVSFRNGIYGECGYVTTFSDSDFHGIKIATYDIGDEINQSKIIIQADNIELDGDTGNLTVANAHNLVYEGNTVVKAGSTTSVIPETSVNVSLGSSTNKFKNIYGDIKLNNNLSFTTQYDIITTSFPTDNVSATVNTNLTDYNIAIKLPRRTFITTPNNENTVELVGFGDTSSDIDLPSLSTTYLAASRVAPFLTDPSLCCIGTSQRKYGDVWANNLHGVTPHVDLTDSDASLEEKYPIGCIIRAWVSFNAFSSIASRNLPAGTENITGEGIIYDTTYDPNTDLYVSASNNLNGSSWVTLIGLRSNSNIALDKEFALYIMKIG